uniref:Calmodulin n=1 Tax=Panagrellus redivivus TaxID=6233 RepID=A0A7E4USC8_PANRE
MPSKSRAARRRERRTHNPANIPKVVSSATAELEEAFKLIDIDNDGFIDASDLCEMFAFLGETVSDDVIDVMMKDAPNPLNIKAFVLMFSKKFDDVSINLEECAIEAFECFDEDNSGFISVDKFRELMTADGEDALTDEQVISELLKASF